MAALKDRLILEPEPEEVVVPRKGEPARSSIQEWEPQVARNLLELWRYPYQRPLSGAQLRRLGRGMRDGTFRPGTIEVCRVGRQSYLVDGQHRLTQSVEEGRTYRWNLLEYDYDTMQEVDEHYSACEGGLRRRPSQMPVALQYGEAHDLTRQELSATLAASLLLASGFRYDRKSPYSGTISVADRVTILAPFAEAAKTYWRITKEARSGIRKQLTLGSIVAVALVTIKEQQEKAETFWTRVAANEGLTAGEGAHLLVDFLFSRYFRRGHQAAAARAVATAWNHHYENQTRQYLKPLPTYLPIRIAGTRYTGKEDLPLIPYEGEAR